MRTIAVLVMSVLTAWPLPQAPQRGSVTEYVSVSLADGTPVPGLTREAFTVSADDAQLAVDDVSSAGPLSIAMVLDATVSTGSNDELSAALLGPFFLASLRPGDRVRVFAVARSPSIIPGFTTDHAALRAAILQVLGSRSTGPSPVWDTVRGASRALAAEPGPRVMLLSSDGRGTGNQFGYDDAKNEAVAAGAVVSVLTAALTTGVEQMSGQTAIIQPDRSLRDLARQTGGAFHLDRPAAAFVARAAQRAAAARGATKTAPAAGTPPVRTETIVGQILTQCQQMYALRFSTPADGKVHRLKVAVNIPDATVRARPTFLAK